MGGISFYHVWHQMAKSGDKRPIQVFDLETMAAYFGKFARTEDFKRDDLPPVNYAYHLGAGRYAAFLRRLAESRSELFTQTSWAAVMMGQGICMDGRNAMADAPGLAKTRGEVDEMEKSIRYLVQQMPGHGDYLARYCPAPIAA